MSGGYSPRTNAHGNAGSITAQTNSHFEVNGLSIIARLSQSLWATTPKNFYHPN